MFSLKHDCKQGLTFQNMNVKNSNSVVKKNNKKNTSVNCLFSEILKQFQSLLSGTNTIVKIA